MGKIVAHVVAAKGKHDEGIVTEFARLPFCCWVVSEETLAPRMAEMGLFEGKNSPQRRKEHKAAHRQAYFLIYICDEITIKQKNNCSYK